MRNEEWLESIVQVRNQLKVIDGHESHKLHVLDQYPKWQETNISEEKHEELCDNEEQHDEVKILSSLTHVLHLLIYKC
jgi:hypothetical protein